MSKVWKREGKLASEISLDQKAYMTWVLSDREDNSAETRTEKTILMRIIQEQLTDKQREYLIEFFVNEKSQCEIAKERGLNKSTVSVGINRALDNIHKYLKYVNPKYVNEVMRTRVNLSRGRGKRK